MKQFKQILLMMILVCGVIPVIAQKKHLSSPPQGHNVFYQLLKQANLSFTFPSGFQEIKAIENDYYSYDYAMAMPGRGFEVWLQVKPEKQSWKQYETSHRDGQHELANPDSIYTEISRADAMSLCVDSNSFIVHDMPPEVLARYNADIGKSYLINLADLEVTKHYKYALLVALQKRHMATLVAVYFTNEKDADFYQDVFKAAHSLRFTSPSEN